MRRMPEPAKLLHASAHRRAWRSLLLLMMAVVSWFAFMPGADAPGIEHADKLQHLLAFAALGAVSVLSLPPGRRSVWWAAGGLLAYGAFIEGVQSFLPGRHADAADLLADAAGIALGQLVLAQLRRRWPAPGPG